MKKVIILICILVCVVMFASCTVLHNKTLSTFDYFSTVITLNTSTANKVDVEGAWAEMQKELSDMDAKLSPYKEGSDIYKFNHAEKDTKVEVSKLTYDVFMIAMDAYTKTDGAYNPAMLLLSDLWGFTDRFTYDNYSPIYPYDRQKPNEQLPSDKYVDGFLSLTDFGLVEGEEYEDKYYIYKPDLSIDIDGVNYTMQLDFGGIVKGYAAAVLQEIADRYDINYGYITLGSSSLALLERGATGRKWDLKLKDPKDPNSLYLRAYLISVFISTSGNYEQYYEIDGKRYCHIINPTTGRPIENETLSCTLAYRISSRTARNDSAMLDAYSTALMVMDFETAKEFINSKKDLTAYIALNNGDKLKVYTNDEQAKILKDYERI